MSQSRIGSSSPSLENFPPSGRCLKVTKRAKLTTPGIHPVRVTAASLWISESFERHFSPLFSAILTFLLGLRLAMIQRFTKKAQRFAG
jgi:hypothetical protein